MEESYRKLIGLILSEKIKSRQELEIHKRDIAEKLGLNEFPRNSDILRYAKAGEKKKLLNLLQKKPSRTLSGVAVIAAMTRPHECPHGRCKYCPGGPKSNVPQSYTGKEPATRRAIQYGFHPYLQTTFRLKQLYDIGHPIDKAELIVMGGTLTSQSIDYQEWFVKKCLEAMNDFSANSKIIDNTGEETFISNYPKENTKFKFMGDVQSDNQNSDVRCVGITFEPRPDWCRREHINYMLGYGVTRVEIGVQNPDDEIYEKVDRGHNVEDVVLSTKECKDSGLKVGYHMMPGIQGFNPDLDLKSFKRIFQEDRFKPDMLKIYPCIVLEGTEFYEKHMQGDFNPMTTDEAVDLISHIKSTIPPWVRTMRIMRDIPSNLVHAGIKSSNLGQLVYEKMEEKNLICRCIRCREVGQKLKKGITPNMDDVKLITREYSASGGREFFLSFEDDKQDVLLGFLRLRFPSEPFRPELSDNTAIVRELHVYGPMMELGEKPDFEWQHRGYGKELLSEAESISEKNEMGKIAVISGIGVRNYYSSQGYDLDGVYMSKSLLD